MTRFYRDEPVVTPFGVECDACHDVATTDDDRGALELQEYLHVDFTAGYGSVFGDTNAVRGDFCQRCVQRLLGPYLRVTAR